MTRIDSQYRAEARWSKKLANIELATFVEEHYPILETMGERISQWFIDYRSGKYGKTYQSKDERLSILELHLDEIPTNLLTSVLILGKTTLQATASMLGLKYHEDTILAAKSGMELLAICDGLGYKIIRPVLGSGETFMIKPTIDIDLTTKAKIAQSIFLPPMLSLPLAWTNSYNGGYELVRNSAILGDRFNKHDKPLNYSCLNILQSVSYRLNTEIANQDLPKPDWSGLYLKEDREKAIAAYELAKEATKQVVEYLGDSSFYFVWQYDKRGRIYSKGYHINIQADEWHKAMLRFSKAQELTDRGWRWFKIDIANHFGLDKETWDKRLEWFNTNEPILESLISQADSPILFEASVRAYRQAQRTGKTDWIVRLDATTSGPQLMSVIMRDTQAMEKFNVIGDSTRYDYYTLIAKEVYSLTQDSPIWAKYPNWKEVRNAIKKSLMTYYYNSTKQPENFFGKDSKELSIFYKALEENTKGACELKNLINSCWDSTKLVNEWSMPDGHTAYCPVRMAKKTRLEIKEMIGGTATITFMATVNAAGDEEKRSLAPNVVHSVDAWVCRNVIEMLWDKGIECSPIHDSFGVHPNDCDDLRRVYRATLARLYRGNLIDHILSDIVGKEVVVPRPAMDPQIADSIFNNAEGYYIC